MSINENKYGGNISKVQLKVLYSESQNRRESETVLDQSILSPFLCPPEEELKRRIEGDFNKIYEGKFILKKFERSVAGKKFEDYCDIKNIYALKRAMEILLSIEINKESYQFIDNRIRAIKLDIEQLGMIEGHLENKIKFYAIRVEILKSILRFYVVCLYQLYYQENDLYQVMEQLKKPIRALLYIEESGALKDENGV